MRVGLLAVVKQNLDKHHQCQVAQELEVQDDLMIAPPQRENKHAGRIVAVTKTDSFTKAQILYQTIFQ